jgi:hypothetical protein
MLPDGTDLQPLSYHEINEWTPRVNHYGDIVYSRWDYLDRDIDDGQQPWIVKPDGRNARALYGNYESPFRGEVQEDLRPVPDPPLYVGVMHDHHCSAGSARNPGSSPAPLRMAPSYGGFVSAAATGSAEAR